jgi:hypothetical protein
LLEILVSTAQTFLSHIFYSLTITKNCGADKVHSLTGQKLSNETLKNEVRLSEDGHFHHLTLKNLYHPTSTVCLTAELLCGDEAAGWC